MYICTQSYKAKFTNIMTYGRSNKYASSDAAGSGCKSRTFCFVVFWSRVSYTPDKDRLAVCEPVKNSPVWRRIARIKRICIWCRSNIRKGRGRDAPSYASSSYKTLLSLYMKRDIFDISNGKRFARWCPFAFFIVRYGIESHCAAIKIQSISQVMLVSCNPHGNEGEEEPW